MQLLLVRHADKFISVSDNPELSPRGIQQAQDLVKQLSPQKNIETWALLTSPKTRALMTVAPLSEFLQIPYHVEKGLDEQQSSESRETFQIRVARTLSKSLELAENKGVEKILLCSHLDWLEESLYLLPSNLNPKSLTWPHLWSPAQVVRFLKDGDLWKHQSS